MDSIYKKFIIFTLLFILGIRVLNKFSQTETFSNILSKKKLDEQIRSREEPPFDILSKKRKTTLNPYTNEDYYSADKDYILIPSRMRKNWRRKRDPIPRKPCNKICTNIPEEERNSILNSYIENEHSDYGVINPKIYSHKPEKMLEVYNTNSKMTPNIDTPENLPYTRKTRAEWTAQRNWQIFDPNTLLNANIY